MLVEGRAVEETTLYHLELEYLDKVTLVDHQKMLAAITFLLAEVAVEDQQELLAHQRKVLVATEELEQQIQLLELHYFMQLEVEVA
jgi:hypothetical protein